MTTAAKPIALIVDDEADLCRLIQITLGKMNVQSDVAYNLEMALHLLNTKEYDFCLTDLALPDGSGLDVVRHIIKLNKNIPIAVITAHGNVDVAIEALKLGAFDFVNKPLDLPRLRQLAENALKVANEKNTISEAQILSPEDKMLNERLIGTSDVMNNLRTTIKKLARSQAPVFLSGASGTGKEVVARLIHDLSPRREGSFVPVNCGAIPSELMESEFFGHKKGSFTGATTDKIGLFQQANGGTLFLDEVADLPLAMQVKLLRAIQEKTVRAIGDTKEVPVDIRILSATHKDLSRLVQTAAFRQDLFYRINVIMVKLPTLNERRDDIPMLAQHFLRLISHDWQIDLPTLNAHAIRTLQTHDYAGNVRELRNVLEQAITMAETSEIDAHHLFIQSITPISASPYQDSNVISTPTPAINTTVGTQVNNFKISSNYNTASSGTNTLALNANAENAEYDVEDNAVLLLEDTEDFDAQIDKSTVLSSVKLPDEGLEQYLQNQEIKLITLALAQANGNKTQAAKLLKMTFRSLRYRMKKLEISDDE